MFDSKIKYELRVLLNLSLEGQATDQQYQCLNDLLRSNQDAFDYYLELIEIHHALRNCDWRIEYESLYSLQNVLEELAVYEQTAPKIEIIEERPSPELIQKVVYPHVEKRKLSKFNIFAIAASAAAMLFIVLFMKYPSPNRSVYEIATLHATVGATWSNSVTLSETGGRICASETFYLAKGLVEIKTDNNVDLIIEGPAEFDFTKEGDLRLDQGKVYAVVPAEGIGFTVTTPTSKIIDLGTEFGVQTRGIESTEMHVYKGKVTLLAGSLPLEKIASAVTEGQARLVKSDGTVSHKPINEHLFVRKEEFMVNVRASQGSHYDRWLAYSYKLRRDSDLVAYYTFEKDPAFPMRIVNKAEITQGLFDADMSDIPDQQQPTWTSGRWGQKEALEFNRQQSQYLKVKGESPLYLSGSITLAAWIKCIRETDGGHILSSRMENLGPCNYQFGYKVRKPDGYNVERPNLIQLARKMSKDDDQQMYSPILNADPDWLFIAVTHDQHTVSFYQNGKLVHSQTWEVQLNPVEADLWIGSDGSTGYLDRFFNGVMDELVILKRVVNPNDIREMYESGKP